MKALRVWTSCSTGSFEKIKPTRERSLVGVRLVVQVSGQSISKEFDKLIFLYIDEKFEKCANLGMRYTEDDELRRDPIPYLYVSMSFFEISKRPPSLGTGLVSIHTRRLQRGCLHIDVKAELLFDLPLEPGEIVPEQELEKEVEILVDKLAQKPPLALRLIKEGLEKSFDLSLKEVLDWEAAHQSIVLQTSEHKAIVKMFLEAKNKKG